MSEVSLFSLTFLITPDGGSSIVFIGDIDHLCIDGSLGEIISYVLQSLKRKLASGSNFVAVEKGIINEERLATK